MNRLAFLKCWLFRTTTIVTVVLMAEKAGADEVFLPVEVEKLVRQLGDEDVASREQAELALWRLGLRAGPFLFKGIQSTDEEIAVRSKKLIDKMRSRVTPSTPKAAADLVTTYMSLGYQERKKFSSTLPDKGLAGRQAIVELAWPLPELAGGKEEPASWQMTTPIGWNGFSSLYYRVAERLLREDRDDELEAFLESCTQLTCHERSPDLSAAMLAKNYAFFCLAQRAA